MDELPELPFKEVVSYLGLKERIKARAVSWSWRGKFDFRMNILCYSGRPKEVIDGNSRWASGAYAQNFISSSRPGRFFNTFGPTILSSLKHLRLCDVNLNAADRETFAPALQSLGQLEELDLIQFSMLDGIFETIDFKLNLPTITSIQLIDLKGINKLSLDAPRLWRVKLADCSDSLRLANSPLRLNLVHGESVKRLFIDDMQLTAVQELSNLEYLYCTYSSGFDSTFLSDLQLLKEIHLNPLEEDGLEDLEGLEGLEDLEISSVRELFDQKQRDGRADLKIHLWGLLLDRPDDAATIPRPRRSRCMASDTFAYLAANSSRLADELPFFDSLDYEGIERVAPESEFEFLNKLTDLRSVWIREPVLKIERFLGFLEKFDCINELGFRGDVSQELLDKLPEKCVIQKLMFSSAPSDFRFLSRLGSLAQMHVGDSIDADSIRRAFEELEFFDFLSIGEDREGILVSKIDNSQFRVFMNGKYTVLTNMDALIQRIFPQEK